MWDGELEPEDEAERAAGGRPSRRRQDTSFRCDGGPGRAAIVAGVAWVTELKRYVLPLATCIQLLSLAAAASPFHFLTQGQQAAVAQHAAPALRLPPVGRRRGWRARVGRRTCRIGPRSEHAAAAAAARRSGAQRQPAAQHATQRPHYQPGHGGHSGHSGRQPGVGRRRQVLRQLRHNAHQQLAAGPRDAGHAVQRVRAVQEDEWAEPAGEGTGMVGPGHGCLPDSIVLGWMWNGRDWLLLGGCGERGGAYHSRKVGWHVAALAAACVVLLSLAASRSYRSNPLKLLSAPLLNPAAPGAAAQPGLCCCPLQRPFPTSP